MVHEADTPGACGCQQKQPEKGPLDLTVASLGAIALTLFVLIKAYAVARYSLTSAAALLTPDPVGVLLGSLMLYGYSVLPLAAVAAWGYAVAGWRTARWSVLFDVAVCFGIVAALLSPWATLWRTVCIAVGLLLLRYVVDRLVAEWRQGAASSPLRRALPTAGQTLVGFLVVSAFWIVFSTRAFFWIPVEAVKLDASKQIVVGNVLDVDSNWTTIARAGDRAISRYPTTAVSSRRICHLNGVQPSGQRPIIDALRGVPYRSANASCQRVVGEAEKTLGFKVVDGSLP